MLFGVLILAAPVLIVMGVLRMRAGMPWHVAALWVVLGVYALWAADLLFFPIYIDPVLRAEGHSVASGLGWWINLVPFKTIGDLMIYVSGTPALTQIGGNIGLLLPLGLIGPVVMPRLRSWRSLALAALMTSLGIEAIQLVGTLTRFLERSVDIDDVILNVFGALIGWVLWRLLALAWARYSRVRNNGGEPEVLARDGGIDETASA